MNLRKLWIGIIAFALFLSPVGMYTLSSLGVSSSSSNLEFVPLILVAPSSPQGHGAPACTTPAPASTFGLVHCYTPAQIAAAYGVDKLHAAGITGKGETIVIVDSYGQPDRTPRPAIFQFDLWTAAAGPYSYLSDWQADVQQLDAWRSNWMGV